jgi:hypothetical protein
MAYKTKIRKAKKDKYIVTGIIQSKVGRQVITENLDKTLAVKTKKAIQRDMKISVPKYKWVTNLKVEKVKDKK